MRLEFEELRTEENKDFVLLYDTDKTDPIIAFSGIKDKPRAITSSGNSIRVKFISNGENVNNGFKVSYKQTGQCPLVGSAVCSLSFPSGVEGEGQIWKDNPMQKLCRIDLFGLLNVVANSTLSG